MKSSKDLWLKLYLLGHPWFLDLDRQVLIDCLNMENMRFAFSHDDGQDGFCFLYPNPNSMIDENMLVRVVRHTGDGAQGKSGHLWFEIKTLMDNTETVRTINGCGAYREQDFILFNKEACGYESEHGTAPFFGMATFENSPMLEDPAFFEIDFKNFSLIDMENPANIIPLAAMLDTGKGYEFYYDPVRKNIADVNEGFQSRDAGAYLVRFNYLVRMHPRAIALCHDVPSESIRAETDQEFIHVLQKWKIKQTRHRKIVPMAWRRTIQRTIRMILS